MQHNDGANVGTWALHASALLCLLATSAQAQLSEAQVKTDIAFARGLAVDWQYVDLAEEVIRDLESGGSLTKDLTEELGLVKCEIYFEGARREGDPLVRNELFSKAVDSYRSYLDKHPVSEFAANAERGYVEVANAYAKSMEKLWQEALGEEEEALRTEISSTLEEALRHTNELVESLRGERDDWPLAQKMEWARVMYTRGQMFHTMGRTADEGDFFYSQAIQTLETLAGAIGENTPQGMYAFLEMAEVYMSMEQPEDAAAFAEFVVNAVVPISAKERDEREWDQLTVEEKAKRWEIAEKGTKAVVEAYSASGDPAEATRWALHFYNMWRKEGFNLSAHGHLAQLSVAQAMLDSGGWIGGSLTAGDLVWFETVEDLEAAGVNNRNRRSSLDLALSIAQTVNEENKGNTLQILAQKMIAEVIDRPGVQVSPEVLFEAAQGEYFNKNYPEAQVAFKRILRSLEGQDDAVRQEYGARVLYYLGESLRKQGRTLEAAMAYREGVTTWVGDPEYDRKNANNYYNTSRELLQKSPGVSQFIALRDNAEVEKQRHSEDTDDIDFAQANRAYEKKDYADAREKFLKVTQGSDNYEKSLSYAALCLLKQGDSEGAKKEFTAYLEVHLSDPRNQVTTEKAIAGRKQARAQATYYLGDIAYKSATDGAGSWDEVIRFLDGYYETFPDQDSLAQIAGYKLLMAQLNKGDVPAVKATHAKMVENFPTSKYTGASAFTVYNALRKEREKVATAGNGGQADSLARDMVEFLRLGNQLAPSPKFQNLRQESTLWQELGELEEAERVLRQTLKTFGDDPAEAKSIDAFVKPELADVLLEQKRAQEAFDLLAPLVPDPDDKEDARKPSGKVVASYCRSITGWVEQDGRTMTQVPGVGGAENLAKACRYLVKLTEQEKNQNEAWQYDWYVLKFKTAYGYYQLGLADSEKGASARNQLSTMRADVGENFEVIEDKDLRERFQWLWNKVQ